MISNQAPQGQVPTAVRPDGGAAPPAGGPVGSWIRGMNVSVLREVALLPVLVLLIVVGTLVSPAFFTVSNFAGIGEQSSALGVVVVGESLILLIGGMDLSLEATFGLAPMVAAWLIVPVAAYGAGTDLSPFLGILVLLAVGAAVGLINGLLIVKGRLNGFIVTLGILGDVADPGALRGGALPRRDAPPAKEDLAAGAGLSAGDHAPDRGHPRAQQPGDADNLACVHAQRPAGQAAAR